MKLDMQNDEVRRIITSLVGDIYLYARQEGLPIVRTVREVQECFAKSPAKPDNEIARKHESFVAMMYARTAKAIYDSPLDIHPSLPETFHAFADVLSQISDKGIKRFIALNEKIIELSAPGKESEMDAFMSEIEEFNKAMRKELGDN